MPKKLVVVESPTKAKTLERFLGSDYSVKASFGHIRDLPKNKLGVDTERNFEPEYVVPEDSKKAVTSLKSAHKKAADLILATDYDREGEAIAYHVAEILGVEPGEAKRVTFTEITRDAILDAFDNPRGLDLQLVEAQQARLIVDREREIRAFEPKEYWTVDARLAPNGDENAFLARLLQIGEEKLASSPDKAGLVLSAEADAQQHVERLREALDNLSGYDESWLLALEPSRALFDDIGRQRTLH